MPRAAAYPQEWDTYGPNPIPDCPVPGAQIWGWCRIPELRWLRTQAKKMTSVVEIGALRGRSSYALGTGCPGDVWCIDPFDDEGGHCYPAFIENTRDLENVHAITGRSPAAGEQIPGDIDMVYIDGDHSRAGVEADLDYWLPRTRKLICGHDYVDHPEAGYPDVKAVVDERFKSRVKVARDTAIWYVTL